MRTSQDRQFELIQQLLLNDITATSAPKFASQRTLFGIKSSVETLIERTADEENQRIQECLRSKIEPEVNTSKEMSDEV